MIEYRNACILKLVKSTYRKKFKPALYILYNNEWKGGDRSSGVFLLRIQHFNKRNTQVLKSCCMFLSGNVPPGRKKLGDKLLNEVYKNTKIEPKHYLRESILSLDGWSKIH